MNPRAWICALLFAALAAGACSSAVLEPRTDLRLAREQWRSRGWDDYRFDFERQCFCIPEVRTPVTITVRDGVVTEVRSRADATPLALDGSAPWPTVERIFDEIEAAARNGQRVDVVYGDDHLPVEVTIGQIETDAGTIYLLGNYRLIE